MTEIQVALGPVTTSYVKMERLKEEVQSVKVIGDVDFDSSDVLDVKDIPFHEIKISAAMNIRASTLSIDIHLNSAVMVDRPISEQQAQEEPYRSFLLDPLLSKVSQIVANLSADSGPYPLILKLNPDDIISGEPKAVKSNKKKKKR